MKLEKILNGLKRKKQTILYGFLILLLPLITAVLTHLWEKNQNYPEPKLSKSYIKNTKYQFIKPGLVSEVGDKKTFKEYAPLEKKLTQLINQAKSDGAISDAGLYFRNMESGRWTGINEDGLFSPGSLLKVPLMIAYFQEAEEDNGLLTKKLYFEPSTKLADIQAIEPEEKIEPGQSYPVNELIKRMIIYSDNDATNLLFNNIDHNALKEVFSDLGLKFDEATATDDFISPKEFGLFFRILYNGSYLNRDYSESALQLLSQTTFSEGINAGLPKNTVVAHKFGERELINPITTISDVELHDCGVVYLSDHPYVLCVMTKGKNLNDLKNIIKNISETVYQTVKKQ